MNALEGKRIAILATDGFEQSELEEPKKALVNAGADVHIVSLKSGEIRGWSKGNWADKCDVDKTVKECDSSEYDGLVLPGGVINPDKLRMDDGAVQFVQGFVDDRKPIAAICHGPWTLIETGCVSGKRMTSYPSLKTDLINAGAEWVDEECVTDKGLVTSRSPDDLPAFCEKMVEEFAEGPHTREAIQNRAESDDSDQPETFNAL